MDLPLKLAHFDGADAPSACMSREATPTPPLLRTGRTSSSGVSENRDADDESETQRQPWSPKEDPHTFRSSPSGQGLGSEVLSPFLGSSLEKEDIRATPSLSFARRRVSVKRPGAKHQQGSSRNSSPLLSSGSSTNFALSAPVALEEKGYNGVTTAAAASSDAVQSEIDEEIKNAAQKKIENGPLLSLPSATHVLQPTEQLPPSLLLLTPGNPTAPSVELQKYGCCVFFFPTTIASWLLPFAGHVGISNAEGTRLFTFESSYYVREERLVDVLDRVLGCDRSMLALHSSDLKPDDGDGVGCWGSSYSLSSLWTQQRPSDASASASDTGGTSPVAGDISSPTRIISPSIAKQEGKTLRRIKRGKAAGATFAAGHAHTRCVRIWDLKPLLMESRGQRHRRVPCAMTSQAGKQAAAVLWERLQELIQPVETAAGSSAPTMVPRREVSNEDRSPSIPSVSSGSDEKERQYELLDADTARFYNTNLGVTIRIFRGSADGSKNSPDVVLQHHNSFSFVGFVLEACGVGSQGTPLTAIPFMSTSENCSTSTIDAVDVTAVAGKGEESSGSCDSTASPKTTCNSRSDEIHWGAVKLLCHIFLFGKWHRSDRRVWRVLHGGNITTAIIIWTVLLAVAYHYVSLLFS